MQEQPSWHGPDSKGFHFEGHLRINLGPIHFQIKTRSQSELLRHGPARLAVGWPLILSSVDPEYRHNLGAFARGVDV